MEIMRGIQSFTKAQELLAKDKRDAKRFGGDDRKDDEYHE